MKGRGSSRRHKPSLANDKATNGVTHLTNGSHSKAENHQEEALLNGHHSGTEEGSRVDFESEADISVH